MLANHISATRGPLASERIADAIEKEAKETAAESSSLARQALGVLHSEARALLKRWRMNKPGHKSNIAYTRHRFPDTTLEEVQQRIAELSTALKRFETVRVEDYSQNIFSICNIATGQHT